MRIGAKQWIRCDYDEYGVNFSNRPGIWATEQTTDETRQRK